MVKTELMACTGRNVPAPAVSLDRARGRDSNAEAVRGLRDRVRGSPRTLHSWTAANRVRGASKNPWLKPLNRDGSAYVRDPRAMARRLGLSFPVVHDTSNEFAASCASCPIRRPCLDPSYILCAVGPLTRAVAE